MNKSTSRGGNSDPEEFVSRNFEGRDRAFLEGKNLLPQGGKFYPLRVISFVVGLIFQEIKKLLPFVKTAEKNGGVSIHLNRSKIQSHWYVEPTGLHYRVLLMPSK